MNCQKFESQIESFLAGKLAESTTLECRAHLESCRACSELLDLIQRDFMMASPFESEELVQAVLEKTIGQSCQQARELLPDLVEEDLLSEQRMLLEQHLQHCPSCLQLHQTLKELKVDLPRLAEIDPGRGFTNDVMRAARGMDLRTFPGRSWLGQTWRQILYRPRIAWEAAYAMTLLFFALSRILAFVPGWSSAGTISSLQARPAQLWKSATSKVENDFIKYNLSLTAKQDRWLKVTSESKNGFTRAITLVSDQTILFWKSTTASIHQVQNSIWNEFSGKLKGIGLKSGSDFQKVSPPKDTK